MAEAPVYTGGLYTGPAAGAAGYAGGVVPYERGGRGQGSVRVGPGWQGRVRVGYRPPPGAPMRAGPALRRASSVNTEPPPGYYDPARDFAVQTNKQKLEQSEENAATTRQRSEDDYWTRLAQLQQKEGYERQNAQTALAAVKRSYGALAGRQEEQANRAGVLQSGALLQAAAKRASNQGLAEAPVNTNLERALTGGREAREALALQSGPPVSGTTWEQLAGGGAGRVLQDLAKQILNARVESTTLAKQEGIAKGYEAGQAGYEPVAAPAAAPRAAKTALGQRFLNRASGRMETARQIRGYRRR